MKKTINYLVIMLVSMLAFYSCSSETEFDESLLIGKWSRKFVDTDGKTKTDIYRYDIGGKGVTWVPEDDVSEEEAEIDHRFEWELEQDELTHIHISSNIGGNDQVKIYTVTVLNTTTLSYKDDFGKSYTFTKTN